MSASDNSTGSSFASSDGSSLASDKTDSRALNVVASGAADGDTEELDSSNKSFQEGVFATLHTLTKDRQLDATIWLAVLKVVLEFLQMFRVLFNSTWPWKIQQDLWIFSAIRWTLFKMLVLPAGYGTYIAVFYFLAALVLASLLATVWVAVVLKGSDSSNVWLNRLIKGLQLFAMVIYTVFWPAILDYFTFMWDCKWSLIPQGSPAVHTFFQENSCLAMPHMVHMLFAGVMVVIFGGMTLLMSTGGSDLNPMTRSVLASADAATSCKLLALKMGVVMIGSCLDNYEAVQVVLVLLAIVGITMYLFYDVPYYRDVANVTGNGLWGGLLLVAVLLNVLHFNEGRHLDDPGYAERLTWAVLYGIFPVVLLGAACTWARMSTLRRLSAFLKLSFAERKQAAFAASAGSNDEKARAAATVSFMADLRTVYRWKDVEQVSFVLRDMRKWDEDGVPDPEAAEFGEFVLKCAMARMPNNPSLLVIYANFLIEVRKDGQAARTQMQLAQKANPTLLDNYNIYVAQQLAKLLKRDGDGLDLLGYVELQRNYRACVRGHKLALMAQRQFWNSLLRDSVSFKDLLARVELMEAAEQRATATYRRVLERYPSNGKVLKVYGRFLEFVCNDPWTAAKYYEEAVKQGTTESMMAMTAGQASSAGLTEAVGSIDEKTDGLVIINAKGIILMVNSAALSMFGYGKGEVEGKNISMLMPPPFSTHHDSFLRRFVETGIPHIANKKRNMVALHKDRTVFPIFLCATRLSGVGADMLFMGLVRRLQPASVDGKTIVRFWTTASGSILCSDRNVSDSFGLEAADLLGQSFCNLCTDSEGVNKFFTEANRKALEGATDAGAARFCTQVLHSYLSPVDVELSMEFGGALDNKDGCRTICVQACVLCEAAATLVLDHKAHVVYATDKLATMLGYPVASLLKLELGALLPQPYCQLYKPWLSVDLNKRNTSSSCTGGGVVHILAANGAKLPVTLKVSTREAAGTGRPTHLVQVARSSEATRLDQRRLLLSINHKGVVLEVNAGAPKALYGFEPSELVGRPLAAIVDVFGLWRHQFGEDDSLLTLLAAQAMDGAAGSNRSSSASWRVGVHQPVRNDADIAMHAARLADDSKGSDSRSLLQALQQRDRLQAACMTVDVLAQNEELAMRLTEDSSAAESTAVLQVSLFRADALSSVVELDKHLAIAHADESAGLMFGINHRQLLRKSFASLVGLPASTSFEDLLGSKGAASAAKKGAMKGGAAATAGASRVGQVKRVTAHHLGDGKPLALELQALSYSQGSKTRHIVQLNLQEPCSASMPALLLGKEGKDAGAVATKAALADAGQQAGGHQQAVAAGSRPSSRSSMASEKGHSLEAPVTRGGAPSKLESVARTIDWVRETSQLPRSQNTSPNRRRPDPAKSDHRHHRHSLLDDADEQFDDEAVAYVSAKTAGKLGSFTATPGKGKLKVSEEEQVSNAEGGPPKGFSATAPSSAGPGSVAESASVGGSASLVDGASEAGGSASSMAEGAHDEDLAVDARRAKRLKKLNRMVQSSAAQQATTTWRRHTLVLLGIILLAHIVCFAVLTTQIDKRYANSQAVSNISQLLFYSLQLVVRAIFLQKCWMSDFRPMEVCNDANIDVYYAKLQLNAENTHMYHQMLYLGSGSLPSFQDQRLVQYWTYKNLSEQLMLPVTDSGINVMTNGTRTLWAMGNNYVTAAREVIFFANQWKASMVNQTAWQYIYNNGAGSLYQGYAWSLDTFTDYAWTDLTGISLLIIVLLVVEALVVQLGCMAYEFYLLQRCNVSHMRLFSVFLALPSATVRLMTQRQLQVDDDSKEELDEDDLDLAEAAAGAATGAGGATTHTAEGTAAAPEKKQKSVRLAAGVEDDHQSDDDDGPNTPREPKRSASASRATGQAKAKAGTGGSSKTTAKRKPTGFAAYKHSLHKLLFGWLDPKFKRNGKKLLSSSSVLWRFMVPLLLWVVAVAVIFAVSYDKLEGLQGPLASLDVSAHVMYRLTRARLAANMLGFSETASENSQHRSELTLRLTRLQQEYQALLYGGDMLLASGVNVSFNPVAPVSVLDNAAVADLFFKTTNCLRADQSTCCQPGSEYYSVTHSGIDAMMQRYIDNMRIFAALPDDLAFANHSTFLFDNHVVATDMVDGLRTAGNLFVDWTISRLEAVKQLHMILLVISLACMALFLLVLYQPYVRRLHRDSKAVAGLLSQLPAEVDVEGHVKTIVLGIGKAANPGSQSTAAGFASMNMPPTAFGTGTASLMLPGPGATSSYGWQGLSEAKRAATGPGSMWQGANGGGGWYSQPEA